MTKETEMKLKASKYANDRKDFLDMLSGLAGDVAKLFAYLEQGRLTA